MAAMRDTDEAKEGLDIHGSANLFFLNEL